MVILQRFWGIVVVLLITGLILFRIFHPGFFQVHDDVQPTRIYEMTKALHDGLFPVRWVQDLGFGYGYPIFNFYGPVPYYIGSFTTFLQVDALTATKIMLGIAVTLAAMGMYLFIRSFLGELAGVAASCVYVLFPYFAVNLFVRGAVGELYAYAFLPYIFWGLFKLYYLEKAVKFQQIGKWILTSSIALSLLIASHNLSAYMMAMILTLFIIGTILFSKQRKVLLIPYFLVFIIAFFLSAFYTLPVFSEVKYTDVTSQLGSGFKYDKNFVCPIQLWDSPWGFAGSAPGCVDGMSYRLGKSNILFALLAIILGCFFLLRKEKYSYLFSFCVILLLFAIFMTTEYSQFLWQVLPNIAYLQFPWRFLNYAGFGLAMLSGFFVYFISKFKKMYGYIILTCIVLSTLLLNQKLFKPQNYNNRTALYYTDQKQVNFSLSSLTSEYMPSGFSRPSSLQEVPKNPIVINSGKGAVNQVQNKTGYITSQVTMSVSGTVHINQAYFPAWHVFVDNKETRISVKNKGFDVQVPVGKHNLIAKFIQTPIEKTANMITLTGVIAVLLGIIFQRRKFHYGK